MRRAAPIPGGQGSGMAGRRGARGMPPRLRPPACASSARSERRADYAQRAGRCSTPSVPRLVPPTLPACSKGRLTTYTTLSGLAVALCPPARASLALPTYLPQPSTSQQLHTPISTCAHAHETVQLGRPRLPSSGHPVACPQACGSSRVTAIRQSALRDAPFDQARNSNQARKGVSQSASHLSLSGSARATSNSVPEPAVVLPALRPPPSASPSLCSTAVSTVTTPSAACDVATILAPMSIAWHARSHSSNSHVHQWRETSNSSPACLPAVPSTPTVT